MPQLIRHHRVIAALMTALCLPMLTSPAEAAPPPTKNTLYKDASVDSETVGSIKIKIGGSTGKVAKLTLTASCDDGKEKVVEKNISFKSSDSFSVDIGPGQSITGTFKSKHKVTGNFRTDLCGFFGGSYTAKD